MSTDKMALLFQPTSFFSSKTVSIFAHSNHFRRVCIFAGGGGPITLVTSICPQASPRLPLDGFSWNLILGTHEICQPNPNLVKRGHFTWIPNYFSSSSNINPPHKRCLHVIWCQAVRTAEEVSAFPQNNVTLYVRRLSSSFVQGRMAFRNPVFVASI
jgi:hypothetical protein